MGLLDPKGCSERSHARQGEVICQALPQPRMLPEESWHDFAFAEIWTQPVMSRRTGYLVALASEVLTGTDDAILGDHVRSALKSGELSVAELREAALHLGPCAGWVGASRLNKAVTLAVRALGIKGGDTNPGPRQALASGGAGYKARTGIGRRDDLPEPTPLAPYL